MKAYVHVDADDLDQDAVGTVEKLGAATIAKIKAWVGHHRVTIQPVLDMQRRDAVDSHDPPRWMRELVILRDSHCVFPDCTRDARSCDLDHITSYDPKAHPARPIQPTSPACAGDTIAPRPPDAGATPHARGRVPLERTPLRDVPGHRARHPPHLTDVCHHPKPSS